MGVKKKTCRVRRGGEGNKLEGNRGAGVGQIFFDPKLVTGKEVMGLGKNLWGKGWEGKRETNWDRMGTSSLMRRGKGGKKKTPLGRMHV